MLFQSLIVHYCITNRLCELQSLPTSPQISAGVLFAIDLYITLDAIAISLEAGPSTTTTRVYCTMDIHLRLVFEPHSFHVPDQPIEHFQQLFPTRDMSNFSYRTRRLTPILRIGLEVSPCPRSVSRSDDSPGPPPPARRPPGLPYASRQ